MTKYAVIKVFPENDYHNIFTVYETGDENHIALIPVCQISFPKTVKENKKGHDFINMLLSLLGARYDENDQS